MAGTRARVEPKAQAAGLAGTVAGVIIYLLQVYAFKGSTVPAGIISLIFAAVPGVLALAGAWIAPHQSRPGDAPAAPAPALTLADLDAIAAQAVKRALAVPGVVYAAGGGGSAGTSFGGGGGAGGTSSGGPAPPVPPASPGAGM